MLYFRSNLKFSLFALFFAISSWSLPAQAQDVGYEKTDFIPLWPGDVVDSEAIQKQMKEKGFLTGIKVPAIEVYLPPAEIANGTAIVVCPGGGYGALGWGEHVLRLAPLFTKRGIAVVGVMYRVTADGVAIPEDPLKDFNQAVKLVKKNAKEWNIDPDKLVGLGYSAGANLLLQYACSEASEEVKYLNMLCLWPYMRSAESYEIKKKNLDVIIFGTKEDKVAPVQFSVGIEKKLIASGSKVQLVKHAKGSHAAYNIYGNKPLVDWTKDFFIWLEERGLVDEIEQK